jgi:hypothetical protein
MAWASADSLRRICCSSSDLSPIGDRPACARDGRTLFYRTGQAILAVSVRGATPADWSAPEKLFEGPYFFIDGPDVSLRVPQLSCRSNRFDEGGDRIDSFS